MGRREKPVVTSNSALRDLATWLREQRERVGRPSYRELAERAATCHATTLQRAASGESVPKLSTVLAYARACDASPGEAKRRWKAARYEETRAAHGGGKLPTPRPELIRDVADLSAALAELYKKAGSPSMRTMEQQAGGLGLLPRSTAHRIVNKRAVPHDRRQFEAYLRACEVPETEWDAWQEAWARAWRHEKQDDVLAAGAPAAVGGPANGVRFSNSMRSHTSVDPLESDSGRYFEVTTRDGRVHYFPVQTKHSAGESQ
ncbi:helix-turn-helix domain-containing protein [Streptomyces sp. CA-132043]|uniref:helix-turn-helix domain-containing protein n=1 Tax=Streptomyces sp. CA-132043 TaxID=3240048 RepID=UPI003D9251F1